jgi:hypothetical protein
MYIYGCGDELAQVHAVFSMCGITNVVTHTSIIKMEGFATLQDIGVMENDKDVNEMAKRLASCTVADNRVNLGTVTIKKLQGLVFWIKDNMIRGQELDLDDFTTAVLRESMTRKSLKQSETPKDEPSVKELDKFDPAYFEVHEDAFLNLLAQMREALQEPLHYVVHPDEEPDEFENKEQRASGRPSLRHG